uniref:Zinc finger protein 268 n=1 Tax=Aotus nancymaae TaxID=37293 RepID=A0A2K5CFG9_AOTNA
MLAKGNLLLSPQVPPLQERNSSWDSIRKLQDQESILGQGTPDLQHLPGTPRKKQKSHRTEKVLECLFISQEQPQITKSWTKSGKLMILWNEVWQKALNALHLENYVFLVQVIFRDKNLIHVARMEI